MTSGCLSELRALGASWRDSFPELRFLGQIALERDLCEGYWKALGQEYLSQSRSAFGRGEQEDLDATVAVVLSNLAFFFDPVDAGSEETVQHGFISFVMSRLHWSRQPTGNQQLLWEERIGRPVRRLLENEVSYVESERDAGAWRFVRPILRQGGVPLKLIDRFLKWFEPLAGRFDLTELEYRRHLEGAQEPGTILRWFLYGPQGYEFCAAVLRGLRSVEVGHNGVRSELIVRAREHFARRVRAPRQRLTSRPSFALDVPTLTLGIRIPDEAKVEYRHEGTRVYGFLPVRAVTPDQSVRIDCRGAGLRETIEIPIPVPLPSGEWLAFTEGTGRLIAASSRSGIVPRGRFVIVAGEEILETLDGAQVEMLGELESLADEQRLIATVCEFSTASEISVAIGRIIPVSDRVLGSLEVEGVPAVAGTNIFIGQKPAVRVAFSAALSVKAWFTSVSSNNELAEPQPAEISEQGTICYEISSDAPTKVNVWVEPVGFAPRSWLPELMETEFVVFPHGTVLAWPFLPLSYDEAPSFVADGAAISEVRANGQTLVRGPTGKFVLPNDEVVVVVITTTLGLSVQITRRVRRVHLYAPELEAFDDCPVLFLSDLEESTPLLIDVPEFTAGQAVDLGVVSSDGLTHATTVVLPHTVRRGHRLKLPSRTLRDPLSAAAAGMLALRIDRRVVRTGALYARSPMELVLPDSEAVCDFGYLEESLGDVVRQLHHLREHPVSISLPELRTRNPLRILILRIATLAAILDGRDPDSHALELPEFKFLQIAARAVRTGEPVGAELLKVLSDLTRDPVVMRVSRWGERLASMMAALREQSDLLLLIQRWRDCWHERVLNQEAVADTVLYRMEGGPLLTEGARRLFNSLRSRRPIEFLSGDDGALQCLRRAAAQSSDTVSMLANAFLIGALLRIGSLDTARRTLEELQGKILPAWRPLARDLESAVMGHPPSTREVGAESVRVWDIQPEGIMLFEMHGGD